MSNKSYKGCGNCYHWEYKGSEKKISENAEMKCHVSGEITKRDYYCGDWENVYDYA